MAEGFRGAAILIVNDYEFGILTHKTGLTREELLERVPIVIVTHGPDGSTIHVADGAGRRAAHAIPPARIEGEAVDPTGVGDMYRAGLLRGLRIGAPWPVGRPDRQRQRGLRPGGPGAAAAPLYAGGVPREVSPQLRGRSRARAPVLLTGPAGLQFLSFQRG